MGASGKLRVVINNSFANQRVTGQQRYASEIKSALTILGLAQELRLSTINLVAKNNALLSWAETLFLGLKVNRKSWLLTLTSRGPLWAHKHAIVVHDLFVFRKVGWFSPTYRISHKWILRLQLKFARLVICVSPVVASELERLKLTRAKIVVAPNAAAAHFELPNIDFSLKTAVLEKFGVQEMSFVLALGAADPRKNIHVIIEAHKALPRDLRERYPLLVLGSVNSNLFRAVGYELDQFIRFEEHVEDKELALLYNQSAVFVFPSHAEGFGLPLVEALTAGAKVIANDIEVFRWIAGDSATYVSCDEGGGELSQTLKAMLLDDQEHSIDNFYKSPFSWSSSAKIILDSIAELEKESYP
jgi:glycosyltransferase involved in cell wall biosynthesis